MINRVASQPPSSHRECSVYVTPQRRRTCSPSFLPTLSSKPLFHSGLPPPSIPVHPSNTRAKSLRPTSSHSAAKSRTPTPQPLRRFSTAGPQQHESRCLQLIVPGLYVAFAKDETVFSSSTGADRIIASSEDMLTRSGKPFTHIVDIQKRKGSIGYVHHSVDNITAAERLTLTIPDTSTSFQYYPSRSRVTSALVSAAEVAAERLYAIADAVSRLNAQLDVGFEELRNLLRLDASQGISSLDEFQLLTVNDFLHSSGLADKLHRWKTKCTSPRPSKGVHVLITVPRDRRADAIAVAMCFVASEFSCSVYNVLDVHNQYKNGCLKIWQGVLSREGADHVDFVTQLVRPGNVSFSSS